MADQTPLHERLQPMTAEQAFNFAYMNPVTARSAARMLAAERWHDILERRKGEHEGLPADVERLAARGMRAASEDMRTFAAALVDFAGQAHGAGVLDDVVRFAAAQLADLEEPVNVLAALQEARPLLLGTGVGDEDA